MLRSIKALLKKSNDISRAVHAVRVGRARRARGALFEEYLRRAQVPRLQISSGGNRLKGWLNTDYPYSDHFLDMTEPLPFSDGSFRFILCEHAIEHIHYNHAIGMLGECYRVLQPGGVLRVLTPDLDVFVKMMMNPIDPDASAVRDHMYQVWILPGFHAAVNYRPLTDEPDPVFVINDLFRNYEHKFIYNFDALSAACRHGGFDDVRRVSVGLSDDPYLCGVEMRTSPPEVAYTLAIEARKQICGWFTPMACAPRPGLGRSIRHQHGNIDCGLLCADQCALELG